MKTGVSQKHRFAATLDLDKTAKNNEQNKHNKQNKNNKQNRNNKQNNSNNNKPTKDENNMSFHQGRVEQGISKRQMKDNKQEKMIEHYKYIQKGEGKERRWKIEREKQKKK